MVKGGGDGDSDTSSPVPPTIGTPPPPPSPAATATSAKTAKAPPAAATAAAPPKAAAAPPPPPPKAMLSPEQKRKQQLENKLQNMLFRQKEFLKKDIAKKRALQEKELQVEIHREIEMLKRNAQHLQQQQHAAAAAVTAASSPAVKSDSNSNRRKRRESEDVHRGAAAAAAAPGGAAAKGTSSQAKERKRSGSMTSSASSNKKSAADKLHCLCKTKYDPTKFYVGCDVCNEWFHGSCVKITESMSKKMREFVCDECTKARNDHEIYCLCRQPFDETQFYIGCERCSEWYHGRCVGILQCEADKIDEYNCPKCDPHSKLNRPNLKQLTQADHDLVKKLAKQLMSNRNANPFKDPVDPSAVPNYYKVVKEPMDLHTIEQRVNGQHYNKLGEFVGDVMRIFENCRFFNQPHSAITKSPKNSTSSAKKSSTVEKKKRANCTQNMYYYRRVA